MTTEPDFDKLREGVLYFRPEALAAHRAKVGLDRFATAATWADWSRAGRAEVWKLVALSVHLDPQVLPWQDIPESMEPMTAYGLFASRMRSVMHEVLGMFLPTAGEIATPWEQSIVRVVDFVRWAQNEMIRLPSAFPTGDGPAEPAEQAEPRRAARTKSGALPPPNGLMRLPEVLDVVGFSAATLWRKVKAKSFPAPTKVSARITAWRRADVETWVGEQGVSGARPRRAGKVDRQG